MKFNWATRFTVLRILLIVPFVSCMLKIHDSELTATVQDAMRYIATAIYLFMAISDALDGYVARMRRQVTKLGTFLDPVADKLLITSACLLLVSQRARIEVAPLPTTVVVLIIGKDVLITIGFVLVYFITSQLLIAPVRIGKIATALQMSMVATILLAPEFIRLVPGWIWLLRVVWWSAAASAVLATLIYVRNGIRYVEQYEQANAFHGRPN
jgi:cardiolipin synthase